MSKPRRAATELDLDVAEETRTARHATPQRGANISKRLVAIPLAALAVVGTYVWTSMGGEEDETLEAAPKPSIERSEEPASRATERQPLDIAKVPDPAAMSSVLGDSDSLPTPAPAPAEPSASESPTEEEASAEPPADTAPSEDWSELGESIGSRYARTPVNVRSGPGTGFDVVSSLAAGAEVEATDRTHDGFRQITVDGTTGWVSEEFLTETAPKATETPSATAEVESASNDEDWSKLADNADTKFAASALNVRTGPGKQYQSFMSLSAGAEVQTTTRTSGEWQQVNIDGKAGWISSKLLTSDEAQVTSPGEETGSPGIGSSAPCSRCAGAEANSTAQTVKVMRIICNTFPDIKSFGGYRSGGGSSYHNSGRAIDVMVSGDRGWDIAYWAVDNAKALGISEVIYQQKIWYVGNSRNDWRPMEDRGSVSANHYDHVHISVP